MVSFILLLNNASHAQTEAAASREFLLLEVKLDGLTLSEAVPAYADSSHTFLPLGTLTNLLTLGIDVSPAEGTANGFILSPENTFALDARRGRVSYGGRTEDFDPTTMILAEPDDLYIARTLLERWFPLRLQVNYSRLLLEVTATEPLPLQAKLERLKRRSGLLLDQTAKFDQLPKVLPDYQLLSPPFIDQTFSSQIRRQGNERRISNQYSAFLTSDLLYMESALRVVSRSTEPDPDVRLTLSRFHPDGTLLGPLKATSVVAGNYGSPSSEGINRTASGNGLTISNRSLTAASDYDQQTLEGDLPEGWDVELYYNDVFVGVQIANDEGRYRFADLPLNYGRNDFRLVFNGPLGQTRVETQSFDLSDSLVPPGSFRYRISEHRDDLGDARSTFETDFGLTRTLTVSSGFVRTPLKGEEMDYGYGSLRIFGAGWSGKLGAIDQFGRGHLAEVGVRTRLGESSVNLSHARLNDFDSEIYPANNDPVVSNTRARLNGSIKLPPNWQFPYTIDSARETRTSGAAFASHTARISAYLLATVLTNRLSWQETTGSTITTGALTASRRISRLSFRSQLDYAIRPRNELTAFGLNGSVPLSNRYRVTAGLNHQFQSATTLYSLGFTKSAGRFGLALNTSYDNDDDYFIGAQIFLSLGPRPTTRGWLPDAQPIADTGAASVHIFHDQNNNGIREPDETGLPGIGLRVNGTRYPIESDSEGVAFISQLPPRRFTAVDIDESTFADPLWQPTTLGNRVLARPGHAAELDIPVVLTNEIDGTVYLVTAEGSRGIGDVEVELVDRHGQIISSTKSSWDGFYVLEQIPSGDYTLRISPEQQNRLNFTAGPSNPVSLPTGGNFVSGQDFMIEMPPE